MDYYSKDVCYDKYPPPCFFEEDEEEDFYNTAPGEISPSEDIWKKFELLPTPPRSPRREPLDTIPECLEYPFSEISDCFPLNQTVLFPELECGVTSLKSKLIQDCMWSGNTHGEDLKKPEKTAESGITNSVSNGDINASTDCVDPAAVFPYPISGSKVPAVPQAQHSLGTDTPSDSASSDDEEEIDVVTVDKKVVVRRKTHSTPNTTTIVVHKPKSSLGHHSVVLNNHHDYSISASSATSINILKRPRSISMPNSPQSHPSKRVKHQLSMGELAKGVAQRLKGHSSSRASSDSEDSDGKRTQHNVLERKRRNDLKYSFMTLRDNVPELNSQERAPKVLILKKASEHIHKLNRDHSKLKSELESQRQRREQLQRRLASLRRN